MIEPHYGQTITSHEYDLLGAFLACPCSHDLHFMLHICIAALQNIKHRLMVHLGRAPERGDVGPLK